MRYNPGGYQGVPNQREFRAAAIGRPLQWERSDRPAALAAYLNVAFRSILPLCRERSLDEAASPRDRGSGLDELCELGGVGYRKILV